MVCWIGSLIFLLSQNKRRARIALSGFIFSMFFIFTISFVIFIWWCLFFCFLYMSLKYSLSIVQAVSHDCHTIPVSKRKSPTTLPYKMIDMQAFILLFFIRKKQARFSQLWPRCLLSLCINPCPSDSHLSNGNWDLCYGWGHFSVFQRPVC